MSIIQTIHQLEQTVSSQIKAAFADAGHPITSCQFMVLRAIKDNTGSNQIKIVNITGIDRSTLADVVKRLMKAGLIRRYRNKHDTRSHVLSITEQGEEVVEIGNAIEKRIEDLVSPASKTAIRNTLSALKPVEIAEAA